MKTYQKIFTFSFVMVFSLFFSPSQSFSLSCIESLEDLEGVEVLVEEIKGDLENFDLTAIQLQTDVESKLRMAGIKVLSKEENEKIQPLRKPYLYIKVSSYKPTWKREGFAFNVEIALKQQVVARGKPKSSRKAFYAPTWYTSRVGAVSWKNISEIRDIVTDLTEKFIKAYLTANPKK